MIKILEGPSIEFLGSPDLRDERSVLKFLERAGRTCYKSEDRITDESCYKFINMLFKKEHESVMEHVVYAIEVSDPGHYKVIKEMSGPFLTATYKEKRIISGNIRAWRNFIKEHKAGIVGVLNNYLHAVVNAVTFEYREEVKVSNDGYFKLVNLDDLTDEEKLKHIYRTARITCDRSTSHQLVRHRIAAYSQESQRFINYGKRGEFQFVKPVELEAGSEEYWIWMKPIREAVRTYKDLIAKSIKPEVARSVLPNAAKTEIVITLSLEMWRHVINERYLNSHAQADIRQIFLNALMELNDEFPGLFEDQLFTIVA